MYFFFLILFSLSSFASDHLHESPKWIKLLHYKKSLLGNYKSEADSENFFLHKDGKTNPKAELIKTIEIFSTTKNPGNEHAICKFPLRYKWLNKELGFPWSADLSGCKKYISFFSKLAARRASIVFSSYYLTNPNSAFGHTLLRLSRYDDRNETEMLDYGINYAAQARESNPFLYAMKGLLGGFKGEFAAIPYYYKIREYSNFEFRDLWSYDLKLSTAEVLEMVDHIWELSSTYFDYFYFHENCSYHLLSILEVARPTLELTNRYNVFTIPADTIRLLAEKDLIEEGKRRESTYSKLVRVSESLNETELKLSKEIAQSPEKTKAKISGLSDESAARILDVSMEAFDYYNFEKILKDDSDTKKKKNHILIARATNPVITHDKIDAQKMLKDSPSRSHSPTRLTLAEKYLHKRGAGTRFELRPALHDLLDPAAGSLKQSQLELGKISLIYQTENYEKSRFMLDSLSLLNIKNLEEQNFWVSPHSWEIDLGVKQLNRLSCFDCPGAFLNGSLGNSLELQNEKLLLSFLLNSEMNIQSQFINNYRIGIGPKLFTRMKFTEKWVSGFSSIYHFNTYEHDKPFEDFEWHNELEIRHHFSKKLSFSLRGGGIERKDHWQGFGEFGVQYFYQ